MKLLIVILLLLSIYYFSPQRAEVSPFPQPVYGDFAVEIVEQGNELSGRLLIETRDFEECQLIEQDYLQMLFRHCIGCQFTLLNCSTLVPEPLSFAFSSERTSTPVIRYSRASNDEREIRVVFRGYPRADFLTFCRGIAEKTSLAYQGTVECG